MANKKDILKKIIFIIISILIILMGGFYIYTLDYYHADDYAIQTLSLEESNIQIEKNIIIFHANDEKENSAGLIFYPGGKVEATAYAPLLEKLSRQGITSVLINMPFNLAVFDVKAADRIYDQFPNIENWYIGGHSLGGAMASSYANKNTDKIKGLILLGAYPVGDSEISTIEIFGSEDIILDKSKLNLNLNNLKISGGNHAYFGNYGEQKGDGTATISRDEQQDQTIDAIIQFVFGHAK